MATAPATGARAAKRKRRGGGGCCGCLLVVLLVLGGSLWLARKWAPNHLNRGLAWGRVQVVTKYPALDRWLPRVAGAPPTTVFEPSSTPAPIASPVPLPLPTPGPAHAATAEPVSRGTHVPTELVVGTGATAGIGQTVEVRFGAKKPATVPERFMLGAGDVEEALDRAVRGMRVGGKRQVDDIEIELVRVL